MNTIKIIVLALVLEIVTVTPSNSQSVYEFGIKFTNDSTATLVGADGLIQKTTDGGVSWTSQESNTTNVLYCTEITYQLYSMNSPTHIPIGITVGENGMILRSITGGMLWNIVESGTISHLRGITSNISTQSTVVCGDNGTILYSSNAGESFSQFSTPTASNLYAVAFSPEIVILSRLDARKVLAVGDNGAMIISGNDGITWDTVSTGITANLRAVSWADPYTAIVVGENGAVYNTSDRGLTWKASKTVFTNNFYGVKYLDDYTAIAVGDNGKIFRSINNGMTWVPVQSNTQNTIMSVNFANSNKGIAVGEASTNLVTNDGGQTWSPQNKSQKNILSPGKSIKREFSLNQNYPNPFNPSTTINYTIPEDSKVSLRVYDLTGKEVSALVNGIQTKGSHSVNFNAKNLTSGIYFYRIMAGSYNEVKKMILIK